MPALPTPGGDDGIWGGELNAYLLVSLNADGTFKATAISGTTGDVIITAGAAALQNTVPVNSRMRTQLLDEIAGPGGPVSMSGPNGPQPIKNLAAPQSDTDAATALGSQLGFKRYAPGTLTNVTTSTSTGSAIDTTNLTVSFTAISSQVLVELTAPLGFASGFGSIGYTLYNHNTLTQQGNWVAALTTTSANEIAVASLVRIYVGGLTAGQPYQFDWGWAVAGGTSPVGLIVFEGVANAGFAATNFGEGYMRVIAQ